MKSERWRATFVVIGWGLLCTAAAFLPDRRVWGFNHLAFLPWTARVVFAVMMAAALFAIWRWPKAPSQPESKKPFSPGIRELLVLVVVCVLAAWQLRAATPLLGDGYLFGDRAEKLAPGVIVITDCLPVCTAAHFHRLMPAAWNLSGRDIYAVLSVLAGLIYLLGLILLWPRLTEDGTRRARLTWKRWLPVFWLLTAGSMQLFFGYIETYALAWAFLSLFTMAILAHRTGRLGWVWPVILWVAAFWAHISSVAWVPLLLFEMYRRGRGQRTVVLPVAISLIAAAGSIVTLWAIRPSGGGLFWSNYFLPLWGHRYSILSWRHLADALNQVVLLIPAVLPAVWSWTDDPDKRERVSRLWLLWSPTLFAYIVFHADLGWARDWDLFSLLAAPVVIMLLLGLARRHATWSRPRIVATAAIAISSVSMWVWVNASESASVTRFDRLLALDSDRSQSGREVLARYWREKGRWDLVADELGKALAVGPHARLATQRGIAFGEMGMPDSALVSFEAAIQADSTAPDGYFGAGQVLWATERAAESLPYLGRAVAMDSTRADYRYHLGMALRDLGRPSDALPHLAFAAIRNPGQPDYATAYSVTLYDMGDYEGAVAMISSIVQRHPEYNLAYLNMAWVLYKMGKFDEATRALAVYDQREPDSQDPNRIRLRYLLDSLAAGTRAGPQ